MSFTSRWVCKANEDYSFDEVKRTLSNYYDSIPGQSYSLSQMTSVDTEIISTSRTRYLPGRLVFQVERPYEDTVITEDRRIEKVPEVRRYTFVTDFWISSRNNLILFKNSNDINQIGKDKLSEILFGDKGAIKSVQYNIESIESAVNSGNLHGMWTYCFSERNGNIKSAMAYGNDVNRDPIYGQTAGSPRNFIGIEENIDQRQVKVSIFRYGSINVLANYEDPLELPKAFKIIEKYLAFTLN